MRQAFRARFLWKIYLFYSGLFVATTLGIMAMVYVVLTQFARHDPYLAERLGFLSTLILAAALCGTALTLALGLLIARGVTGPMSDIMKVADAMRKGHYDVRVRRITPDEFGVLAITLNRMGQEIMLRMATISQERAQLKAILAGMREGIIAISPDDRILFCNDAIDELLHCEATQKAGHRFDELAGLGVLLPIILEARGASSEVLRDLQIGDGENIRQVEVKATSFRSEHASGVIVQLYDVTDMRRLERVGRDFVANVSHELKTPLTSIKGYVETLLGGALLDEANNRRFLQKIGRNVDRLVALVQDILNLARIESPGQELPMLPVDWRPIIRQVISDHEDEALDKKLSVEFIEPQDQVVVQGEREGMQLIFDNLLVNALRYTPTGGKVTVTLRKEDQMVNLAVADTGIGIPKEHLPRIFERFYRVDRARSREVGGTGLGLSIVKHLVHSLGGQVFAQSEDQRGSVFTVRLPLG